jgi:hypothetical protein
LSKGPVKTDELYKTLYNLKPDFPTSTSREEHGWAPFLDLKVDRHHHRKKNDISIFSDAVFKGGVFLLSSLDLPMRPNTSEKFI